MHEAHRFPEQPEGVCQMFRAKQLHEMLILAGEEFNLYVIQ